jgi:hypothetical protein
MLTHSVFFRLKHAKGSPEEIAFLRAGKQLGFIPGVIDLECVKQTSPENDFDYGITMRFARQQDHDTYSNHPAHSEFIQKHWIPSVLSFMEIDHEVLEGI